MHFFIGCHSCVFSFLLSLPVFPVIVFQINYSPQHSCFRPVAGGTQTRKTPPSKKSTIIRNSAAFFSILCSQSVFVSIHLLYKFLFFAKNCKSEYRKTYSCLSMHTKTCIKYIKLIMFPVTPRAPSQDPQPSSPPLPPPATASTQRAAIYGHILTQEQPIFWRTMQHSMKR